MVRTKHIDIVLLVVTILLLLFGLAFVFSASSVVSSFIYDDKYYFIKRQLIYAIIGIIVMFITSNIDISIINKRTYLIFIISLVLLILVSIPFVGMKRGGARSWLGIGALSMQPSEIAKVTIILLLAKILSSYESSLYKLKSFVLILLSVLIVFGLIMLQPDFGTGLVIVLASVILMFSSPIPFKYFFILFLIMIIGAVFLIISAPYRMARIFAFLDPFSDPLGSGFQAIQSIFAIAPSGIFGLGFMNSMQKHFFLPEPQNDFIFAIICEEIGLIGGLILLTLFLVLIIRILVISKRQENLYYKYLGYGISFTFFVQVFVNIGVVIGILPITGITLPIISYGGTSLICSLFMIGVVQNISRYSD